MKIAVIIPAILQTDRLVWLLIRCASLIRSTQHDLSLTVIANRLQTCPPHELESLLKRVFVGDTYIHAEPGVEYSVGESRNVGWEQTQGVPPDYYLFLDTDTELDLIAIDVLVDFGNKNPDVVLWSGGATNYPGGPKDPASVEELPDFSCCMFRPQTFADHGLFDPYYRMAYGEDIDYMYRVWLAGGRTACVSRAKFIHHTGMSKRIDPTLEPEMRNALAMNEKRFIAKWGLPSHVRTREEVLAKAHKHPFGDDNKPLDWCGIPDVSKESYS